MKITVECRDCGKAIKADLAQLIKTLIDCAAHDHIYSGFMCEYCAEANHIEDDDEYEVYFCGVNSICHDNNLLNFR